MAGKKFKRQGQNGERALRCPRMAPKLYNELRDRAVAALRLHFNHVIVAVKAPEKTDHGDVDILVCLGDLKGEDELTSMQLQLSNTLGATRSAYDEGVLFITSPIPSTLIELDSFPGHCESSESYPAETTHPDPHVQYDLVLCHAPSQLAWATFRQAHGDLSNVLQTGLQDAGFTFKPSGLHIRIPMIEKVQRSGCSVFLSNSPEQVLTFFGMCPSKYTSQFESEEALFEWISSCAYFSRNQLAPLGSKTASPTDTISTNDQANARNLSTYLEYMADREMFTRFRQVWLADHPELGSRILFSRQEILEKALDFFEARSRYVCRLTNFQAQMEEEAFWKDVHTLVQSLLDDKATKHRVTQVKEGLKRFVRFKELDGYAKRPVISLEPQMLPELQPKWTSAYNEGGFKQEELLQWIARHWEAIQLLERARDHPRRLELARRKRNKKIVYWFKVGGSANLVAMMLFILLWFAWSQRESSKIRASIKTDAYYHGEV